MKGVKRFGPGETLTLSAPVADMPGVMVNQVTACFQRCAKKPGDVDRWWQDVERLSEAGRLAVYAVEWRGHVGLSLGNGVAHVHWFSGSAHLAVRALVRGQALGLEHYTLNERVDGAWDRLVRRAVRHDAGQEV